MHQWNVGQLVERKGRKRERERTNATDDLLSQKKVNESGWQSERTLSKRNQFLADSCAFCSLQLYLSNTSTRVLPPFFLNIAPLWTKVLFSFRTKQGSSRSKVAFVERNDVKSVDSHFKESPPATRQRQINGEKFPGKFWRFYCFPMRFSLVSVFL